jgi:hypothetical protein
MSLKDIPHYRILTLQIWILSLTQDFAPLALWASHSSSQQAEGHSCSASKPSALAGILKLAALIG